MARELQLINGLAVVLIAFIAGLEMNFDRLRPRLAAMVQLGGISMLLYIGLLRLLVRLVVARATDRRHAGPEARASCARADNGGGELLTDGDDCAHCREPRQRSIERDDARGA